MPLRLVGRASIQSVERLLTFRQIACTCGTVRISGVACPDCGAAPDPREVDPASQGRRRDALEAEDAFANATSDDVTIDVPDRLPAGMLDVMSGWLEQFMEAWASAGEPREQRGESGLVRSMRELTALKVRLEAAVRLRPWLAVWRALDAMYGECEAIAGFYLATLTSAHPLSAQRAADDGQRAIDRAAVLAGDIGARVEQANRLLEADIGGGGFATLAREAMGRAGATNVLDLERVGIEIWRSRVRVGDCPPGLGGSLTAVDLVVDVVLDRMRFWTVVEKLVVALRESPDVLARLSEHPEWSADFQDATLRLYDSFVAHEAVTAVAKRDRDHTRAMLTLAHDLAEGATRRYLAMLVTIKAKLRYERMRNDDLGALLQRATQGGYEWALDGLDRGLRNARAHETYDIANNAVTITDRARSTVLLIDELVDAVLTGFESTLALQLGILVAAATVGRDLAQFDPLLILDMPVDDRLAAAAAFAGLNDVDIDFEARTVRIRGVRQTPLQIRDLTTVAAIVAHMPPDTADTLELHSLPDGGALTGPLAPLHRYRVSSGLDKEAAFVETACCWEFDGTRILGPDYVRKWCAAQVGMLLAATPAESARGFRTLRLLADRVGDAELRARLGAMQGAIRTRDLGVDFTPQDHEAIAWFSDMERQRLPDPYSEPG